MNKEVLIKDYRDFFNKKERHIEIPKGIAYVNREAFKDNKYIKKLTLHSELRSIGISAFEGCENLEKIKFFGESELIVIPEKCFMDCVSLESFVIPKEVAIIKKYAFKNCTNIKSIEIPENVVSIEAGAFDMWNENQTIIMHKNFKFGMVCKASIINLSENDNVIDEDLTYETSDGRYMYAVECKCGHVGRHRYMPKTFGVIAETKKEAAKIARQIPRVKHDHKDAILNVTQISKEEFDEINELNKKDPYLRVNSKHEQNRIKDYIDMHTVPENNYKRRD